MRILTVSLFVLLGSAAATTLAADANDDAALSLADAAPVTARSNSAWRVTTEAAVGRTEQRYGLPGYQSGRLSLDVFYDGVLAPGWRLIFGDRLDRTLSSGDGPDTTVNTLKEAYVSWRPEGGTILDVGRVNARYGVGYGYNPTDYFRTGAIRSVVSLDPNSLRENRLGTVMVRGQTLLPSGSLTALYAPKIERTPSAAAFSPDFGATNNRGRWLLAASRQFSENFNPQLLAYGGAGQSVQVGANLTTLLDQSSVAFFEWSGGKSRSLYDDFSGASGDDRFRQRLATGLTYTSAAKVSLTAEFDYNGAGLSKSQWAALGKGAPAGYAGYGARVQDLLELPTRSAVFLYGTWQDALVSRLDLKALVHLNLQDRSRLNWIEARYHFQHVDLSLQLQHNGGNAFSEYGALPRSQVMQAMVTYYF